MLLVATDSVKEKILVEHRVEFLEADESFNNFVGHMLEGRRSKHRTKPITVWCLSETCNGRLLKLVFIPYTDRRLA